MKMKTLGSTLLMGVLIIGSCDFATDVELVEVGGTGVLLGQAVLDSNGNGGADAGDQPLRSASIVLTTSTGVVVLNATTDTLGLFVLPSVPVGSYDLSLSAAVLGDSLTTLTPGGDVTVELGDTTVFSIVATYPTLTLAEIRSAAPGRRVFTQGLALNSRLPSTDGTVHLMDTTTVTYLRTTGVTIPPGNVVTGDSVRLLGRTTVSNGQPTLDVVTPFVLQRGLTVPPPVEAATGTAATADGAALDAALVRIRLAEISDTSTAPNGDFRFWSDDGSDSVEVVIRSFLIPSINVSQFRPDTIVRVREMTGLLSPYDEGTGSIRWRLLPRAGGDIALENKLTDVGVTTVFDTATASLADTIEITVVASNNGPLAATSVQVRDTVPAGVGFLSANVTAGSYSDITGLWDLGSMDAGVADTLRIIVVVTDDTLSSIVNIVEFLGLVREVDTSSGNNTASASLSISTPGISVSGTMVGAGLQFGNFSAVLGASDHGGVMVTLQSANPSVMLVSPNAATAGTASIDVFVTDGQNQANYYVHGVEGTTGTVQLTVSAPGFTSNAANVTVLTPAFDLSGVPTSLTTFSPDDPFQVRLGLPNSLQTGLSVQQAVRSGGATVTATITSSATSVGDLITLPDSTSPVAVGIVAGQSQSPNSVAAGGVAFNPIAAGTSTLSATIPGFIATDAASADVSVTAPGISVSAATVGAGLQAGSFNAVLGTSAHGGVTVRLQSANPSVVLVSPDATTAGAAFIDVVVADGQTPASYYVQGVEGTTGVVQLTASAPGFTSNSANITIVQPWFDIFGLLPSETTLSPDDAFQVRVGLPDGGQTQVAVPQAVRIGGTPLTTTVTSSVPAVGVIKTASQAGPVLSLDIVPGSSSTPATVAAGGFAFDPLGAGTTTVTATIPGFAPTANAALSVTVTPGIALSGATVGAGLQDGSFSAVLGTSTHGGVTVRLESANPSVMLVSPDATTAGTTFIDVFVANGMNQASYFVHGVEGTTGSVPLTASAPGFASNVANITVVPSALDIVSLNGSYQATAADDPFWVRLGIANGAGTAVGTEQAIRVGGTTLTATVTSSNASAAQLVTTPTSGATIVLQVLPGQSTTPLSVAAGGGAIDPLVVGSTTITATIPGVVTTGAGSRAVTIDP